MSETSMVREIEVTNKQGEMLSRFKIACAMRQSHEFQLDPQGFYLKHSKEIPQETVEMRLIASEPYTLKQLVDAKTHLVQGKDKEWYICYPTKISSQFEAVQLAKTWCLITTFHMEEHADISWFESFGEWLLMAATANKKIPKPFDEFPRWITEGWLKWKVESR